MIVLIVNAGSSSLKYQLFNTSKNYEVLAKGLCDCIGHPEGGKIKHKVGGKEYETVIDIPNHSFAVELVVKALTNNEYGVIGSMREIEAVGHRIVHGGPYFSESVLVCDEVLENLEKCRPLAVRRYGAHGTSHRYVSGEMCKILGRTEGTRIITCHLGNGSSISAVKDGKCMDTSMGLTPLAGIIMGSRTGDMDPAVVPYIIENYEKVPMEHRPRGYETLTAENVNNFMNKASGLLGVSQTSSDMRAVIKEIQTNEHGHAQDAKLAYDILIYGIKKYIGAYAAAMNGVDAIVFTAGIGENNAGIRKDVCKDMDFLGIDIDDAANESARGAVSKISSSKSKVEVYMIPTDEELMIAKDTESIVRAL